MAEERYSANNEIRMTKIQKCRTVKLLDANVFVYAVGKPDPVQGVRAARSYRSLLNGSQSMSS